MIIVRLWDIKQLDSVPHFDFALSIRLQFASNYLMKHKKDVYDKKSMILKSLSMFVWRSWIPSESDPSIEDRITNVLHEIDSLNHRVLLSAHEELSKVRMYVYMYRK